MRTRYQNLRSSTALARPAPGAGLPGQFWVNMADQVVGWFNDAGAPVDLPFVKPGALDAYLKLAGGTLTGPLVLSGAPTQPLNPATKAYADAIDTAIRAAFAAADNAIRVDFAAADTAIRNEFRAADTALSNDINALSLATSNALATKLPLAGGTLTGLLTLSGAPTQPLHAAPKSYVDQKIAEIPAPVIPPGTIISDTAPASPKVGQLWFKTVEPVGLYIWYQDADSSQWVQVSGGGSGGQPQEVTIVQGASGWQVVGDVLICTGSISTLATGPLAVVFPREFRSGSAVSVTPNHNAANFRTASFGNRTATGMEVSAWDHTGARVVMNVNWIAIGEARDEDKMPTTVGGAGGAGGADFATTAEARAGVRPDVVMSPALVRALNGRMTSGSLLDKTTYTFTGIPAEAAEIEVFPRFIGPNAANQSVLFRANGLDTGYISGQQRIVHTAAAQWVVETTVGIAVTMETAADNVSGYLRLIRSQDALWAIDGKLRLSAGRLVQLSGTVLVEDITSLVLVSGGTGFKQSSGCDLRWRI